MDKPGGSANKFDAGDIKLQGVTVNLWDMTANMVVKTTTTDINGNYLFEVPSGQYAVEFLSAGNYSLVVPHATDDSFDSDPDPITRMSPTFFLEPGGVNLTIDAGYGITVPLEWLDFWGEHRDGFNYLEWSVGHEENVSHYEIERGINDGFNFEYIGRVNSSGDDYEVKTYSYDDFDLEENGVYYYRIKQIDNDGFFSYTDVITIDVNAEKEDITKLTVYPNPINGDQLFNINITSNKVKTIEGEVYDMKGALIMKLSSDNTNVGIKNIQIDITNMPAGAYILRVTIGTEAFVEKITKL